MPANRGKSCDKNLGRLTSVIDRNINMSSFSSGYLSWNGEWGRGRRGEGEGGRGKGRERRGEG